MHTYDARRSPAAVSLAVTEPQAALLELALLRDQWDELEQIHAKAASYVNTLESMRLVQV